MDLTERAGALHGSFLALYEHGRLTEALEPATELFALLRTLPPDALPALTAEVGNAAANLVNLHLDLDRTDDAVTVANEAVTFCRSQPDAGPRTLLLPLNNLISLLMHLDRHADASDPATELVALLRQLPPDDLPLQPALLATALADLGTIHDELGRPDEAIAVGAEAIERLEPLAATDGRHLTKLVTAYTYVVHDLADAGDVERAAALSTGYVDACRRVAALDPDHDRALAAALHTAARQFAEAGRTGEALAASAEALAVWRALAKPGDDDRFTALILFTFADIRTTAGTDLGAALPAAEESVALYRALRDRHPFANVDAMLAPAEATLATLRGPAAS